MSAYAIFVAPAPGRALRFPTSPQALVPATGMNIADDDLYWSRRLRDGDVILPVCLWDNTWPPPDPAALTDWDGGATVWDVYAP